jgi:hypothetical protein
VENNPDKDNEHGKYEVQCETLHMVAADMEVWEAKVFDKMYVK